jgi:hypothetical protein
MIRFFPASKITLSGVSRANAKDMRLDVWDCVETYMIGTTPCMQPIDHFQIES